MTPRSVKVRIPATTANLGPGFDCLALALDLWNTCTFSVHSGGVQVTVTGEGAGQLAVDSQNLIARAFFEVYRRLGYGFPPGVSIHCENRIPLGSGLGSSAAAVLAGIAGANALLGMPLDNMEMLTVAHELEGHADNAAAAMFGGLTLTTTQPGGQLIVQPLPCKSCQVVVVLPNFALPTIQARRALPEQVTMRDAVFNLGHALLAAEALRTGNLEMLSQALQDRLHQPYRIKLIPGAEAAIQAAQRYGAPAALSGAGPSVIAFVDENSTQILADMQAAFSSAGLSSRSWHLQTTVNGLSTDFA